MCTQLVQGDCRESSQLEKVFDGVDAVICILGTTAFPSARYSYEPLLLLDCPHFPCQPSYMQFIFCLSLMLIHQLYMHGDEEHDILVLASKESCVSRTLWCCIGGKVAMGQNRQTPSPPVI